MSSTVTQTGTNASENEDFIVADASIMGDGSVIFEAKDSLFFHIRLILNELNEDHVENCRTQRLTVRQKQLLPLFAQLYSAAAAGDALEFQDELVRVTAKGMDVRR